jgi:hypothetical protein
MNFAWHRKIIIGVLNNTQIEIVLEQQPLPEFA